MARLTTFVHVHGDDGVTHVFGPDSTVPAWVREAVTNPNAWDGADEPSGSSAPPRAGKGSGLPAWADYASRLGIEVPEDATREDIFDLVDALNS